NMERGNKTEFIKNKYIQYGGILLPSECHSAESLEFAQSLSVEDTDVFVVTFPKSGTVY
uniref:Uncharacterized protein n=1 Tax=Seriola dumerili TaxID=41447 RepID=A0A3B4UD86_SERDU